MVRQGMTGHQSLLAGLVGVGQLLLSCLGCRIQFLLESLQVLLRLLGLLCLGCTADGCGTGDFDPTTAEQKTDRYNKIPMHADFSGDVLGQV
jgi:hypothetical protein